MKILTFNEALRKQRPRRLRDIDVREISLVDRPANPGALIVFAKREGAMETTIEKVWKSAVDNARSHQADTWSRGDYEDVILAKAKADQRPGETPEDSLSRLLNENPEAWELWVAAEQAEPDPPEPITRRATADEVAYETLFGEIHKRGGVEAVIKAVKADPSLWHRYEAMHDSAA